MNRYLIVINIVIYLIINPFFSSYSFSNTENKNVKYLKVKTFNLSKDKFDYKSLKKIGISKIFPRFRLVGEESCKSNKRTNKKWKNTIIFYGDKNFLWGVRDYSIGFTPQNGVRIYMGIRKNNKIIFKVIEAHERWDNMLNWINGYSLNLKNESIENALNQTLKGNYASSGSYRRKCELRFTNLIKTKDTYDHLLNIKFIEKRQKEALEVMDRFGVRFSQKYDFENIQLAVKEIYDKEKKQEAKEKAKKLAEEKAKKEAEEKISKISEKFYETNITLINTHNIMEKIVKEKNIIKKDKEIKKLNNLKVQLNKFFQKPIESYTHIEKKKYAQLQVEYSVILRDYYNNGIKSGEIPYPNEYSKSLNKYLIILLTKISNTNHLYEGEMILNDFKRKFSKSEWPEGIDQKIQKYKELLQTARLLIKESNSRDLWQKFIYPSNLHIKNVRLFKQDIKNWASSSSEKFKSFYNKKLYDVSVQKNLNELKEKQKEEEDFFDKISN